MKFDNKRLIGHISMMYESGYHPLCQDKIICLEKTTWETYKHAYYNKYQLFYQFFNINLCVCFD